jgi:hypothetical protein
MPGSERFSKPSRAAGPAHGAQPGSPKANKKKARHHQRSRRLLPAVAMVLLTALVGSQGKGEITSGSNHLGFRCVRSATPAAQASLTKETQH